MKRPRIDSTEDMITKAALAGSSAKRIAAGSVMCVMRSGILKHSFPVAVNEVDVAMNQDMRALRVASGASADFVAHYLRARAQHILQIAMKGGTTVNSVEAARLDELEVPLPPLETQQRIVARIDELFTELDDAEVALARARADLGVWRKALLKAAVTGELTADWRAANPPTETGAELLSRILTDRRTRWAADPKNKGKRYVEPVGPDISELSELPEGWAWATVEQLGSVVTGSTPKAADVGSFEGDIPFFTPGDLDAGFGLNHTKRFLTAKGFSGLRSIPARSILVTCIGATIGKVGFNAKSGATNQQINALVPDAPELAEFIFWYFDGNGRHLVIEGSSSTTMPIINKGDFSKLPVPLPPLDEAILIGSTVAQRLGEGAEMREFVFEGASDAATLRQSILAAAFRGDLVQ